MSHSGSRRSWIRKTFVGRLNIMGLNMLPVRIHRSAWKGFSEKLARKAI